MEPNNQDWSDWFSRGRTVAPNELRFSHEEDKIVLWVRKEAYSISLKRTLFVSFILILFATVTVLIIDQFYGQILFLLISLVAAYAFFSRSRISVQWNPLCLVAETRHFGISTWLDRIPFVDAQFVARPVGGFQNDENELVFTNGAKSYFCLFVTDPSAFHQVLVDTNAVIADRVQADESKPS